MSKICPSLVCFFFFFTSKNTAVVRKEEVHWVKTEKNN